MQLLNKKLRYILVISLEPQCRTRVCSQEGKFLLEDIGHSEISILMIHHIKYVITVPTLSNRIVFDYKYMNLIKKNSYKVLKNIKAGVDSELMTCNLSLLRDTVRLNILKGKIY